MGQTAPAEAAARYSADGFYITPQAILPADLVSRAVEGMDAVREGRYDTGIPPRPSAWNPGDDPGKLCKIEQPQFASQAIRNLLRHPALGKLAAEITGAAAVQVWWVQLLVKPSASQAPTNVGWHQDRTYWNVWEDDSELFTAWIALSDVTAESGPMRFVRGSHRWGLRKEGDFFGQDLSGLRGAIQVPDGQVWEEAAAVLPPGGVSFHDRLTIHGSGPNQSGALRRSFAVHMRTQNSNPVGGRREGLAEFIDNHELCPVIYGRL